MALTRGRSTEHYFEVLQSNLEELERLRSIINDMLFLASADQSSKATKLIESFYRVDASRSNSGANHGLGLAIVKAIALMHGGDVFVRSKHGGNTFGITLPV